MVLARNPLCADPIGYHAVDGRIEIATHVDHVVPRSAGGTDAWSNLQPLCASCHSRKTALHDGGFGRARRATCIDGSAGECHAGSTCEDEYGECHVSVTDDRIAGHFATGRATTNVRPPHARFRGFWI